MTFDPRLEPLEDLNRKEKLKWLMENYGNDVIRLAYTYLKHKQLSEDVAQEVFIKCYENLDTFRNDSSYKTWLIRITVNRCKDVLKSWSYRNLVITEFFQYKTLTTSIEHQYFKGEESEQISRQVLELPVKMREVIILFYYQEISIDEISVLLKVKPNTVKTRLHRGRLKLKESLEGAWSLSGQ